MGSSRENRLRKRYARTAHRRTHDLTYDEILEALTSNQSLAEIAMQAGVSREAMRQLYDRYFEPILPKRYCGHGRRSARRKERIAALTAKRIKDDEVTERVLRKARSVGLDARSLAGTQFQFSPNQRVVQIGQRRCHVLSSGTAIRTRHKRRARYFRAQLIGTAMRQKSVTIVWQRPGEQHERFYVIPNKVLWRLIGDRAQFTIYLPAEEPSGYNGIQQTVDWRKYREAWHLFKSHE